MLHIGEKSLILHILYIYRPYLLGKTKTMNEEKKTPLWLDLRKEYIDDNFAKLQEYLKGCATNNTKDSFHAITIDLLRQRVEDLLTTISMRPLYHEDEDRKTLEFHVGLLATYLLTESDHQLALPAYLAFMGELRAMNPHWSDNIIKASFERLRHEKVTTLGFGWNDLPKIGTDLFAYNSSKLVRFGSPITKPLVFSKNGTAILTSAGLLLTYLPQSTSKKLVKSGSNSLDTGMGVTLRTPTSERLKQSMENNPVDMDEYTNEFIALQKKVQDKALEAPLKNYFEGDEAIIRIDSIDHSGTMHVSTIDPAYQTVIGYIKFEKPSIVYYYTSTIHQYFHTGECMKATIKDAVKGVFNIENQLVDFFVQDTKKSVEEENSFLCKLIDERPDFCGWINELGIAFSTPAQAGKYSRGDFAYLSVKSYGKGAKYGKIYAKVMGSAEETFDEQSVRHDCIHAFATNTVIPSYKKEEEEAGKLSPTILRLLARQMFEHQKSLLKPSDRIRLLANANVMVELVGDSASSSYLRFARTYLRALVQFVRKEDMGAIQLRPEKEYEEAIPTLIRLSVIEILKEYGKKEDSEKLSDAIHSFKDKLPMLSRLARLVQTANAMQGTLSKATLNVIHREIIKTLSIETENDADLEADGGIYLGIESGTQEFKTSMVYPSNNQMQPDEYTQNMNVLKGVCAFLNSTTGGTLYLGVNDQGTVVGIENDMKYLNHHTMDSYMRYVQDTAKKHFGIDTLPYLRIEPLYDNMVVAIHVEPHPYRVVELNNVAYLRVNAESREMPEQVRKELLARKVFTNEDKAAALSLLQHAQTQKKCVVLHDYASSNSGKVSDRLVEAYDVRPEDGLVICFDRKRFTTRVFNINRIGYVEILEDEPWKYPNSHKKVEVDVFHMTGEKPFHVSLQLDLMAKNLLIEEFPSAKNHIKPHKGDDNIWYFDTVVYQLEGVGRFYMGLANRIKILEAPELKAYVSDFSKQYLI